jgi:hypothetical protein
MKCLVLLDQEKERVIFHFKKIEKMWKRMINKVSFVGGKNL